MFGAPTNRESYIRKPAAGLSRFTATNGSGLTGAQKGDVRNTLPSTYSTQPPPLRKKTSEELYKEHKEAAIAWAAKRQLGESVQGISGQPAPAAVTVPVPYRLQADAPKESFPVQQAVVFTISPPKPPPAFSSSPTYKNNTERTTQSPTRVPNSFLGSASQRPSSPPTSQLITPVVRGEGGEVDFGPFSPTRSTGAASVGKGTFSPQFAIPTRTAVGNLNTGVGAVNSVPRESIFARFKKEATLPVVPAQHSLPVAAVLLEPDSVTNSTTTTAAQNDAANKTVSERALDLTGVSSLKQHERNFLLGLLAASPVLAYLLELLLQTYILPSTADAVSTANVLSTVTSTVYAEFSKMTHTDLAASVVLALALSFLLDRNTRATDARIRRDLAAVSSFMTHIRVELLTYIGQSSGIEGNAATVQSSSVSGQHWLLTRVKSVLSLFMRIPVFARFVATILVFGAVSRVVLGRVVEVVGAKAAQYAPLLVVAATVLVCAIAMFLYVRYTLRVRASRKKVVRTLTSVAKALLQQRSRAYPISYLYEEVAEVVASGAAQSTSAFQSTSPKPSSTPAVVHGAQSSSFLGSPIGSTEEPPLFRSPLGMSVSAKENLLSACAGEVHSALPATDGTKVDVLEGLKLAHVWKEVQKSVEADKRVQRLELIMDGKKQACWRLLTGSSQANI